METGKGIKVKQVYIFVAVEAFTRWVEVQIIPHKTAECTAEACRTLILSRYGSPAQIVTDRGNEWKGEFEDLLFETTLIMQLPGAITLKVTVHVKR